MPEMLVRAESALINISHISKTSVGDGEVYTPQAFLTLISPIQNSKPLFVFVHKAPYRCERNKQELARTFLSFPPSQSHVEVLLWEKVAPTALFPQCKPKVIETAHDSFFLIIFSPSPPSSLPRCWEACDESCRICVTSCSSFLNGQIARYSFQRPTVFFQAMFRVVYNPCCLALQQMH